MKAHLSKHLHDEFVLVSAIPPERTFADICESARNSNDNPKDFWRYQVEDIGKERRKTFSAFCKALELDPQKDDDLATAFDYLKRTHIVLFSDDHDTLSGLLARARFTLTGEPKSAISILTTYANNNDMYRKPICVDQLWRHLKEKHGIHPQRLEHDSRISPAIEDLQTLPAMESEAKAGRPQQPRGRTVFPACLAPEGKQSRPPNAASSHWEPSTEQQRACEVVA